MKTKEEIINDNWDNPTDLLSCIPKMMDIHSRNVAIEFAKWIGDNAQSVYEGTKKKEGWIVGNDFYNDETLYNLYLSTQS